MKVSVLQELFRQQLPIIAALQAAGFAAAYLQHGFLPGGDRPCWCSPFSISSGHYSNSFFYLRQKARFSSLIATSAGSRVMGSSSKELNEYGDDGQD
jgi:hypothetical protein